LKVDENISLQQEHICSFEELVFHVTHISPIVFPFIVIRVQFLFRVLYFLTIPKFILKCL